MDTTRLWLIVVLMVGPGCTSPGPADSPEGFPVRIMTVDPGHFHAGLVHRSVYETVDPVVHVFAPPGPDAERHVELVESFNSRPENPTSWRLVTYEGPDYLDRMLRERPGNVVVAAGNNGRKIDYIRRSVDAGLNVLADKPMIIRPGDFDTLVSVLRTADQTGLVVQDIMTERHEATSILQAALASDPDVFGVLETGTADEPAVTKESVHFLAKTVAGNPLVRPAWFLDTEQQGEAIVDVSTHLVDLVLWQLFGEDPVRYDDPEDGVAVLEARSWFTELTPARFERITRTDAYPEFLLPQVRDDSVLHVAANGAFTFIVRGVHSRVSVRWGYENPGGGDTHFSRIRGSRSDLVIRQDSAHGYVPTLYVEPASDLTDEVRVGLDRAVDALQPDWPGLDIEETPIGLRLAIPTGLREGHEAHFGSVMEEFLDRLEAGRLPAWERETLLTKYAITTRAYALSR